MSKKDSDAPQIGFTSNPSELGITQERFDALVARAEASCLSRGMISTRTGDVTPHPAPVTKMPHWVEGGASGAVIDGDAMSDAMSCDV